MSALNAMPSLALMVMLGMRHGLDPDHLAAIDGLTMRSLPARPRWAPWMGGLFALGHGIVVLAVVAAAALASARWQAPAALFAWLDWLPAAMLALLAAVNARALLGAAPYAPGGVRAVFLPSGPASCRPLRLPSGVWPGPARGGGPLAGVGLGMLFALVFDTALQAAAWGYAAAALGGVGNALLIGLAFTLGMGVTDLFDGWVTARVLRSGRQEAVAAFRRRLGWPIVCMCGAMAGYLALSKLDPAYAIGEDWYSALGAAMLAAMAGLYGYTLYGLRRRPICSRTIRSHTICSADTRL